VFIAGTARVLLSHSALSNQKRQWKK